MNSKLIRANVVALALLSGAPLARADEVARPVYKSSSIHGSYYSWAGFYLGVNAGVGVSDNTNATGFVDGGTVGYNFQTGRAVIGFEGDYDWSNIKASSTAGLCAASATGCQTSNNWIATVRGRMGYAFDRFLPYVTGGFAYGNVKTTADFGSDVGNRAGYTIGAGLEYSMVGNWTAKVEYLFVDLSDHHCSTTCGFPQTPIAATFRENFVRFGLNYRFSGPTIYGSRY
jgi:outer membrane immunogenic protein